MSDHPTIVLVQARRPDDRARVHERRCFAEQTGVQSEKFRALNLAVDSADSGSLDGVDVVFVGGAGHFSLVKADFDWHREFLELLDTVLVEQLPMFASCFGFQALAQLYGGRLVDDTEYSEIGTYPVRLTEAGRRDPLFGGLPAEFDAQLGHKDSVIEVPDELIPTAESEQCPIEAFRVANRPVVATQFHPELSYEANVERYINYALEYKGIDDSKVAEREARDTLRPSPEPTSLLREFLSAHDLSPPDPAGD